MSLFRHIRPGHEDGPGPACPRCSAIQLLHRPARFWHCDVCRSLLLLRKCGPPWRRRRCNKASAGSTIVAFDIWLRTEIAFVAAVLILFDIVGEAPAAMNAAFGICTMIIAATFVTDAAAGLRAHAMIRKMGVNLPRRLRAKPGAVFLLGCWGLGIGALIFHLSLSTVAIIAETPRPIVRLISAQRGAALPHSITPIREPIP
jgi:hypothetical protein